MGISVYPPVPSAEVLQDTNGFSIGDSRMALLGVSDQKQEEIIEQLKSILLVMQLAFNIDIKEGQ